MLDMQSRDNMKFGLFYLDKKIDTIEVSSKQYAKKRFLESISVREEP